MKNSSNDSKDLNNKKEDGLKRLGNIEWNNFIAGMTGGAVATAVFHPLELIKVRWIVYESVTLLKRSSQIEVKQAPKYRPKYRSLLDTIKNVYKTENGIKGLYRGIVINTTASGMAWGSYFLFYNALKEHHKLNKKSLSLLNYTLDATLAGLTTILITNPLFLIKTRMCLQYSINERDVNPNKVVKYKNSWHAFKMLIKTDGILGLYKGIVPGMFGTINGTIQIVTYDLMKDWWIKHLNRKTNSDNQKLNSFHYSLFSGMSKILAVTCTYPFQVIRIRIQDQHQNYKNIFDVISKTFKNEKFYGFYKGLIPCLLRVTPAASLTFIVYENLIKLLNNK